jgi:hypothetical protein
LRDVVRRHVEHGDRRHVLSDLEKLRLVLREESQDEGLVTRLFELGGLEIGHHVRDVIELLRLNNDRIVARHGVPAEPSA